MFRYASNLPTQSTPLPNLQLYNSTVLKPGDYGYRAPAKGFGKGPVPDCFAGSATVRLSTGATKTMAQLSLGDRVLTTDGKFEPVETFFHRNTSVQGNFIRINDSITLSCGHFIAVGTDDTFVRADEVVEGQLIFVNGRATPVTSVATVVGTGIYAPITESGTIVGDDVLASCYSNVDSHAMGHCAVRMWAMFGNSLESLNDQTGTMNPHLAKLADRICI